MKNFTVDTYLWSVTHCKQFRPFKKYIVCPRWHRYIMQFRTLRGLGKIYPTDMQVVADALNNVRSMTIDGTFEYHSLKNKTVGVYSFIRGKNKPFVLVLPGGAYVDVCTLVEGYSVALKLYSMGYNVFIGQYRVGKSAHYPNPQDDVADIIRFIMKHSKEWDVNTESYAVCGFSAGGHLAASWSTKTVGYAKYDLPKPDMLILSYPVITMGEFTHAQSRENLLGKHWQDKALQDKYSVELQVDSDFPPTFVWHCRDDWAVPFENSTMLVDAFEKYGVNYEFMPVEGTVHGWALAVNTPAENWLEKAVAFWNKQKNQEN